MLFELILEHLDIITDLGDQLSLVLLDSASNTLTVEQRVELGENAEHLVRALSRAELITEARCNLAFDDVDLGVVGLVCLLPLDASFTA